MKVKTREKKRQNSGEGNKEIIRRSQRLKKTNVLMSTAKVAKTKIKTSHNGPTKTKVKKKKHAVIAPVKSKPSTSSVKGKPKNVETPKQELKNKSKGKIPQKVEIDYKQAQTDPKGYVPVQKTKREINLPLLQTIQLQRNFFGDSSNTMFCDVSFLDDNHVLALDDNWLKEGEGHRICCIKLDETLVSELLVPGYPWSVVVLSPTEVVVTLRKLESDGLLWISIDVHSKSLEITRHLPMDPGPFGLSYDNKSDLFLVSYFFRPYISVLNRSGEEIRKISLGQGGHYRCLILANGNILYLDYHRNRVSVIDQQGKAKMYIKHVSLIDPIALGTDCLENMYIGCYKNGEILKFDRNGKYRATFKCGKNVYGMRIDRSSERMAVAQDYSITLYELDKYI